MYLINLKQVTLYLVFDGCGAKVDGNDVSTGGRLVGTGFGKIIGTGLGRVNESGKAGNEVGGGGGGESSSR